MFLHQTFDGMFIRRAVKAYFCNASIDSYYLTLEPGTSTNRGLIEFEMRKWQSETASVSKTHPHSLQFQREIFEDLREALRLVTSKSKNSATCRSN